MSTRQNSAARVVRMDSETKEWLLAAARCAELRYPGAIGELLSQELLSWMVFGHQLGSDLIMRVVDDLLVKEPRPS
jgi:hypothetical protein